MDSPWPLCVSCRDGFEPRPVGAPGDPTRCRSCSRLCKRCGNYFTTTPEERALQAAAIEKHGKSKVTRPLPDKLPNLCPECRPPEKAPAPPPAPRPKPAALVPATPSRAEVLDGLVNLQVMAMAAGCENIAAGIGAVLAEATFRGAPAFRESRRLSERFEEEPN